MPALLRVLLVGVIVSVVQSASADDKPQTTGGPPVIKWTEAAKHYNQEVVVYGRVMLTRNIGVYTFLNFHTDFRRHFTVLIRQEDYKSFPKPPEDTYLNKLVAVRGTVVNYEGKPEIFISAPEEITILPEAAEDIPAAVKNHMPGGKIATPAAPATSAATTVPATGRLTVAVVNLTKLTAPVPSFCEVGKPGASGEAFKQAAETLRTLNADVVALQWGGDMACATRFNQELISDLAYNYVVGHEDAEGRLHCVLLSRHPITESELIAQFKSRKGDQVAFTHPPLRGHVQLARGEVVTLLVVHMPTKADSKKSSARTAQAKGLARVIEEIAAAGPDVKLLVCGGFAGSISSKPVTQVLGKDQPALAIPGYTAPTDKGSGEPPIGRVQNFILADKSMQSQYAAGSTRIIELDHSAAVAVSFEIAPVKAAVVQPTQQAPLRGADDDF